VLSASADRLLRFALLVAAAALAGASCGDDDPDPPVPLFPEDYAATYVEVRDCRRSADHDLSYIRILADPLAREPYETREDPFPEGAVVLKEEYDIADAACDGQIMGWSVMQHLAPEADADLGWQWQHVAATREVDSENLPRCIGCHATCTDVGYEGTCAEP
jgi:hypothetical protein